MASYKLVDHGKDQWGIELTSGDYKGVVVKYGSISFSEENDDGETCLCSFNYDIIDPSTYTKGHLESCPIFIDELGETLTVLIEDSLKHEVAKRDLIDEDK